MRYLSQLTVVSMLFVLLAISPILAQEAEEEAGAQEAVEQEAVQEEAPAQEAEQVEAVEEEVPAEEAVEAAAEAEEVVAEEVAEEAVAEAAPKMSFYLALGGATSTGSNLSSNWGAGPGLILGYNLPMSIYLGPFTVGLSAEATFTSLPAKASGGDSYTILGIGASGSTMIGPVVVTAGAGIFPSSTGDLSNTTVGISVGAGYPLPVQLMPNLSLSIGARAFEILGSANDSGTTDLVGFGLMAGYTL